MRMGLLGRIERGVGVVWGEGRGNVGVGLLLLGVGLVRLVVIGGGRWGCCWG